MMFTVPLKVVRALSISPVGLSCFVAKPIETLIEMLLLIHVVSDATHIKRSCYYSH